MQDRHIDKKCGKINCFNEDIYKIQQLKDLLLMVLADWLLGPSILIALSLLCKYVNSLFLLMRARMHGRCDPCTHYKSTDSCKGSG